MTKGLNPRWRPRVPSWALRIKPLSERGRDVHTRPPLLAGALTIIRIMVSEGVNICPAWIQALAATDGSQI